MPELPEVEVVREILSRDVENRKIIESKLISNKSLRTKINISFLNNQIIKKIHRKGKQLVLETVDYFVAMHLRMEGKIFYYSSFDEKDIKHAIAYFILDEGVMIFSDFRKFATIDIYSKNEYRTWKDIPVITKIGPEPFEAKPLDLFNILQKRKSPIKTILLDQSIISGIGNIYVNEILFSSKISPFRLGKDITLEEIETIIYHSKKILKKSIKYGGSTISSFKSSNNHIGNYQQFLKVHGNKKYKFDKIGGRGTWWDPDNQK